MNQKESHTLILNVLEQELCSALILLDNTEAVIQDILEELKTPKEAMRFLSELSKATKGITSVNKLLWDEKFRNVLFKWCEKTKNYTNGLYL